MLLLWLNEKGQQCPTKLQKNLPQRILGNALLPTAANDFLDVITGGKRSRVRGASRKETRKAGRVEKKALRNGPPPEKRLKSHHTQSLPREPQQQSSAQQLKSTKPTPPSESPKPKSILKRTKRADPVPSQDTLSHSKSPPRRISRAIQEKLAEDDDEIAALERKLGLKGKKGLPRSFKDDGLEDLLQGLSEEEDTDIQQQKKRKAEGDEWLDRKRREAKLASVQDSDVERSDEDLEDENITDSDADGASDMSLDGPAFPDDVSEEELSDLSNGDVLDIEDDLDGFDSDEEDAVGARPPAPRIRENPYVAPIVEGPGLSKNYIPPFLRQPAASDSEELVRLRRQTQGLVNRLTEANMISILGDIEKIYQNNARQHVTSTLVDLLLISICEPTSLPDTLIILPSGFIAAVYKIIGTDFGAQVIQRAVELFDDHYARATEAGRSNVATATTDLSKETSNLIMLLSELYNFQVVASNLIFDYIRLFLGNLSELNAELLLKIIRTSGPQLRQDDPSALKDIVTMLGPAVARIGEHNISVRTKFMIETINNLKNNKMKTGAVASAITSEHTVRMKKILGSLNNRVIKASEPLRIGLKDIRDSDKKGKWWLVGASWSGPAVEDKIDRSTSQTNEFARSDGEEYGTSDIAQLAREQGMNTGIRVAIFTAIMDASDYQDAYQRLMKLQLKKKQEYEIPKVLIICSGAEKTYNPYYTLIAKRICGDPRLKKSFQFNLWDLFKQMGESVDAEDGQDEDVHGSLDTRQIVNLAKTFGTLIVDGGLGLGVLKNLNLAYLQPKTKMFMEVLFITIFLQSQKSSESKRDEQAVVNLVVRVKDTPQLINGMLHFLTKVVSKTDIAGGQEEKKTIKWACKVANNTLESLVAIDTRRA